MARKRSSTPSLEAPGDLRIVQDLLSTAPFPPAGKAEQLASPEALRDFLAHRGLLARTAELVEADLKRMTEVRSGIWILLFGRDSEERQQAVQRLNRATAKASLQPHFADDGQVTVDPVADGLDGAFARLLAIVEKAQTDGSWQRLKVCPRKACGQLFYDSSPNGSRKWCLPRCGNVSSARASRRKLRRGRERYSWR